ncbi:MAG: hypothetical protein ACXQS2_05910 [Methermicoccaceae archaeon]
MSDEYISMVDEELINKEPTGIVVGDKVELLGCFDSPKFGTVVGYSPIVKKYFVEIEADGATLIVDKFLLRKLSSEEIEASQ